jgi:hypothetical protein
MGRRRRTRRRHAPPAKRVFPASGRAPARRSGPPAPRKQGGGGAPTPLSRPRLSRAAKAAFASPHVCLGGRPARLARNRTAAEPPRRGRALERPRGCGIALGRECVSAGAWQHANVTCPSVRARAASAAARTARDTSGPAPGRRQGLAGGAGPGGMCRMTPPCSLYGPGFGPRQYTAAYREVAAAVVSTEQI